MSRKLSRNNRADDYFELLFSSAAITVVVVRVALFLTGYPQVGSGTLHIAHLLWGGLLMLVGALAFITFIGSAALRLGALFSGIGFGLYIDELGKFITRDNDYFFRPTLAIIYVIFILLYLLLRMLRNPVRLSDQELKLNEMVNGRDDEQDSDIEKSLKNLGRALINNHLVVRIIYGLLLVQSVLLVIATGRYVVVHQASQIVEVGYFGVSFIVAFILAVSAVWELIHHTLLRRGFLTAVLVSIVIVQGLDFYQSQVVGLATLLLNLVAYVVVKRHTQPVTKLELTRS